MDVPFISKDWIKQIAGRFLAKYNPENIFPLEIEEIVEFKLGLSDIVPIANLRRESGHDAYLSKDLTTIFVDEYIYDNVEPRYRFTLAHEVGHILLHKDIFQSLDYNTTEEFLEVMLANTKAYADMEFQADWFAACCLMPEELVGQEIPKIMAEIQEKIAIAKSAGFSRIDYLDSAIAFVASQICDSFGVSEKAMSIRISSTSLRNLIP